MKNATIDISIIIPHYNDIDGLVRLVNTIPKDTNIETIIVDDNSDDDVQKKLSQSYSCWQQERNILVLHNDSDQNSAGRCRNIALRHATGRWLLFSDADDYFADDFFVHLKNCIDSDSDIIFFKTNSVSENPDRPTRRHIHFNTQVDNYLTSPSIVNEMQMKLIVAPWGKLVKKQIVDKYDIWFDEVRYSNDVMFATKLAIYAKKVSVEEKCIYIITEKTGTLTRIYNKNSYDIRKRVLIQRHIFLSKNVDKKLLKELGFKWAGIRYVFSPIVNHYGIKLSIEYFKILKKNKAPLIIW